MAFHPPKSMKGELTTNYNITNKLGLTASYRNIRELNDEIQRRTLTLTPLNMIEYSPFLPLLSRDKSIHNFTTALWFAPIAKMTITTNYGFLQHHTDQAVMFSIFGNGSLAASSYNAESHLYSISSSYQFTDRLNISLMLQEVHSLSEFRPESSADNDTSGVTGLSRVKTVETSFSARSNYRMSKHLTCSMEYMMQDYYDKMASQFDGTVHTVMATLSAKW